MGLFDKLLKPAELPYDFEEWKRLPFHERAKKVCQAWAIQGFGAPFSATVFYFVKILLYVYVWFVFCGYSTDLGRMSEVSTWWFSLEALAKAIIWTTLLEVLGLGGASGPLTGRYVPPLGAITYFLRPGTIKVPLFPGAPLIGKDQRSIVDALVYLALIASLFRACIAPAVTLELVLPIVVLLLVAGLLDRTVYLAARADVYFPMLVILLFPMEMGAGLKWMWIGVWFWAAFSKLTPNFPAVVTVMVCNSPMFNFRIFDGFKKRMFKQFPDDLRPSRTANYAAHFGTVVEFGVPLTLLFFGANADVAFIALVAITLFHFFIFSTFPMGVPMEWNVIMAYGAWVLFSAQIDISMMAVSNPIIIASLATCILILPILGNFFPKYISFLLSMRYYAGTWAYSIWLFRGDSKDKIDQNIPKVSKDLKVQLLNLYDSLTADKILSRIVAFRMMHLPGRLLQDLIPKAVDNIEAYKWVEGEFIAGEVVGWNFGDGHLHHEPVLASIQKRCNFESGDLRVMMVESPTFLKQELSWRIYDAKDGLVEKGIGRTKELVEKMPWPKETVCG